METVTDMIVRIASQASSTLVAACAVYIAKSLNDLNLKIAVIIERVDSHEKRLNKLEE